MELYIFSETYFQTSVWHRRIYDGLVSELKKNKIAYEEIDALEKAEGEGRSFVFLLGTNIAWLADAVIRCRTQGVYPILLCGAQAHRLISGRYSSVSSDVEGSMHYLLSYFEKRGAKKCALYGVNRLSIFNMSQKEAFLNSGIMDVREEDVFYNEGSLANCYHVFAEKMPAYDAIVSVNDFATVHLMKSLGDSASEFLIAGYGGGALARNNCPKLLSVSPGYEKFSRAAISVYETLRGNPDIDRVSVTVKYDMHPNMDETVASERPAGTQSTEKTDRLFYSDAETRNMIQIENMLSCCDEMDFTILKMLTKDVSYEDISETLFCSVNTIKYRMKKMKENCMCESKKELISIMKSYLNS